MAGDVMTPNDQQQIAKLERRIISIVTGHFARHDRSALVFLHTLERMASELDAAYREATRAHVNARTGIQTTTCGGVGVFICRCAGDDVCTCLNDGYVDCPGCVDCKDSPLYPRGSPAATDPGWRAS